MSVKQALRDYIDSLSEEEALSLWDLVHGEGADEGYPVLTPEQWAMVERSLAQLKAGTTIPHEEVVRRMHDLSLG